MTEVGGIAADQLRSLIERIERLAEEKDALTADIKQVYDEAKGAGFCAKTIRKIVRLRKMDRDDRQEQEVMLALYMAALGMETFAETPLGKAAE